MKTIKYVGLNTLKRFVDLLIGDENGNVSVPEGSTAAEELNKMTEPDDVDNK